MPKYNVTLIFDASISVEVEADSPEAAAIAAYEHDAASPRLCHQCSDEVELGDAIKAIVFDEECRTELYTDDPSS